MLDSRPRSRKTRPDITERLLMGCKDSNQTSKQNNRPFSPKLFRDEVRYKKVYDMVADDDGILGIIVAELLKFI